MAAQTRLIYLSSDNFQTLDVKNMGDAPILLQSWVDDGAGNPHLAQAPFVVDPATLYLKPQQSKNLMIIYTGDDLPQTYESAFWLNLYQVRAANKQDDAINKITLNFNTQLKIFYRPISLNKELDIKKLANLIEFKADFNIEHNKINKLKIIANNSSLYNASFSDIILNIKDINFNIMQTDNMLLKPNSSNIYLIELNQQQLNINDLNNAQIIFNLIDDFGHTKQFSSQLKF